MGTNESGNGLSGHAVAGWRVVLSCDHSKMMGGEFKPFAGLVEYCWTCRDDREVARVVDEYRARCQDCTYSRSFGSDRHGAMRRAGTHSAEKMHRVILRCDGAVVARYGYEQEQEGLFDQPPY